MSRALNPENSPPCPDEGDDIPGLLGTVDELRRQAALSPVEGNAPSVWTPEWVLARMVEAYLILGRSPMPTRPSDATGFWPATLVDARDIDAELFVLMRKRFFEEMFNERLMPPTALQASRRDEALQWPMLYLRGRVLEADALTLFASFTAMDRPLAPYLAKRKLQAQAKAARMGLGSWRELPDQDKVITRRALDLFRRAACDRIALMLHRRGVPVR